MTDQHQEALEEVAVIGMAGRFPGAACVGRFWENLANGVDSISRFSPAELRALGVPEAQSSHPDYVAAAALLQGVEQFDAPFFSISRQEATITDPQHRLFLECAWEALEHAGYAPDESGADVGVFAGSNPNDYVNLIPANRRGSTSAASYQTLIGNERDFLCTRVSHKLNLTGPSLTVQTGCSTSLAAVQLACQSLLTYQCSMAIAGGVSVNLRFRHGYLHEEGMILSADGYCRAFDERAGGTVLGEGVGIVVLKRLSEAIEDRDTIHAVIKSAAINNDGSLKVSYTAPSADGQSEVVALAHALADVQADDISYVETHGTATALGDPIEIDALTQAFRSGTQRTGYCAIGSVKTNVGHLDAAAGVTGLIKTILALKHQQIPASLHFEKPNPKIDFQQSPFYVNRELSEWNAPAPRRAGVSSFGIGGTNVHVVLEQAPAVELEEGSQSHQLLMLSARSAEALEVSAENLARHLEDHPHEPLEDVAYTLQVGRRHFEHRRIAVAATHQAAVESLRDHSSQRTSTCGPDSPEVIFMFPGQGSQYVNMAGDLYQSEPTFRAEVDHCCELLKQHLGQDLRSILYPADEQAVDAATEQLRSTSITQPALFVIEYALARLWMSCGIRPAGYVGHSVGEYVAAVLADVLTLEDALEVVSARGRLIQQLPAGSMLAVPLSARQVASYLNDELAVAACNSPAACVVSGNTPAIEKFAARLSKDQITGQLLHTSHAFHSQMMDPMLSEFGAVLEQVKWGSPSTPILSTVTGEWVAAEEISQPAYWQRNLRQTVRFSDCAEKLLASGDRVLLEVGPGPTLSNLVRSQRVNGRPRAVLTTTRHVNESVNDCEFVLETMGRLWLAGVSLDWSSFYGHTRRRRVPLPTYPFQRERYWIEPTDESDATPGDSIPATSLSLPNYKNELSDWFYVPSWQSADLPESVELSGTPKNWLIFADAAGVADAVAATLGTHDRSAMLVSPGAEFAQTSDEQYVIDPGSPEDYVRLLTSLAERDQLPGKILHLWRVTRDDTIDMRVGALSDNQSLGLHSLIFLAQAIGKRMGKQQVDLDVVTNQVHPVTGAEALCPEKATLLGPCKVIPLEYPHVNCRNIDIVLDQVADGQIDSLLALITSRQTSEIVALRENQPWMQSIKPVPLEEAAASPRRLREGGTYMILGGLGGIGLALAEYVGRTVGGNLALVTRSGFPPPAQWDRLLQESDDDEQRERIRRLRNLESLGAKVLVVSADVTDLHQMRSAVEQVNQQFGPIHGVFHSAGIVDQAGSIQRRTRQATDEMLNSKVLGTLILEEVLSEQPLDFLFLFSSMASVLFHNRFGQLSYVAGNSFLDAYSYYRNQAGNTQAVTINWDDWQEVGMSVKAARQFAETYGYEGRLFDPLDSFTPAEGAAIFQRIIEAQLPRILISTRDLDLRIRLDTLAQSPFLAAAQNSSLAKSRSNAARPSGKVSAPTNEIEQTIAQTWCELLGTERIGIDDDYFDLGGDSLLAVPMFSTLEQRLGKRLDLATLIESPTVRRLAQVVSNGAGSEWSPLVELRSGASGPALFCMHAADGNVLLYRELAQHLDSDQTVYGLQSPGLNGHLPGTLEEMAEVYAREIRRIQPSGPYLLTGYCMGGTLALEVAQQLHQQGATVSLLAMLESYNWLQIKSRQPSLLDRVIHLYQRCMFHVRNLLWLNYREKKQFLAEKLKLAHDRRRVWFGMLTSPARQTETADRRLSPAELWRRHDELAFDYEPRVYPGRILHFRPHKEYRLFRNSAFQATGGNQVCRLPVFPAGMLIEPFVQRLAADLQTQIDRALAETERESREQRERADVTSV